MGGMQTPLPLQSSMPGWQKQQKEARQQKTRVWCGQAEAALRDIRTCSRMLTLPCLFSAPPLTSCGHTERDSASSSGSSSSRTAMFSNSLLSASMARNCGSAQVGGLSQLLHPQPEGEGAPVRDWQSSMAA